MTIYKHTCLSIILLLFLSACIDPYDLEGEVQGSSVLVIDGMITNQKGPYQVLLSYSSPSLKSYERNHVSGAQVTITNDEGQEEVLQEKEPGVYVSDSCGMQGAVGRSYQLHVVTPEGKRYASRPEMMQPVADIDSIYPKLESEKYLSSIGTELTRWGIRLYVNTGSKTPEARFYRWNWTETYEFNAPVSLPPPAPPYPTRCWASGSTLRNIYLASTNGLEQDIIADQPITFVSFNGIKLQTRYSILVSQYSLTGHAHAYWEKIQEQKASAGSIFDPPPAQIIGNVYNVDQDEELVLGYFQASAIAEKRFFIRRSELPAPPSGSIGSTPECFVPGEIPSYCIDCTQIAGATPERPAFW